MCPLALYSISGSFDNGSGILCGKGVTVCVRLRACMHVCVCVCVCVCVFCLVCRSIKHMIMFVQNLWLRTD